MDSILYINGLGHHTHEPQKFEAEAFERLAEVGINVEYAGVNWRARYASDTIERLSERARFLAGIGSLTIVGFSAGGSMAFNVFGEVRDVPDVSAVNIAGRLTKGNFHSFSPRHLARAAHMNAIESYPKFYESVYAFENNVLPTLTDEEKQRLTVVKPKIDLVVPFSTMEIEGIETVNVPVYSHHRAGAHGLRAVQAMIVSAQAST